MRPVKLQISGDYWDAFLYDGVLYVFTLDGTLERYRWDSLIRSIPWGESLAPVAWHAFARGRMWYSTTMQQLLRSAEFAAFTSAQVDKLAEKTWVVSRKELARFLLDANEAPNFPHSDVEAYYNRLFVGSATGIYQSSLKGRTPDEFYKMTDLPSLRLAAGYAALGVAAGSEGLWEQPVDRWEWWTGQPGPARSLSEESCQACSWARFDLLGTGVDGRSVIATFSKPKRRGETDEDDGAADVEGHRFLGTVGTEAVLGPARFTFASGDQVFSLKDGELQAATWNPYKRRSGYGPDVSQTLMQQRHQSTPPSVQGSVLDAAGTIFGVVVETTSRLTVLASDGGTTNYSEPVNWRTFPRSTRYVNQLHIINSRGLQVMAYMHDYFIEAKGRRLAATRPSQSVAEL